MHSVTGNTYTFIKGWGGSFLQVIKMLITSRVKDEMDCLTFVCAGQCQSSAAREDQRCLHPPTVHHRRHEADADREHHRPGCKTRLYKATFSFRWKPSIDFETCWFKMLLPPFSGAELVWWWAAESRPHTVFGQTSGRLPDRRTFSLPGLWAEIDGCQGHQEVLFLFLFLHLPPPIFSFSCGNILFVFVYTGTSSMRKRRRLWWSTTSSWRHTLPTESLCLMAFPPRRLQLTRKRLLKLSKAHPYRHLNLFWHWPILPLSPQSLLAGMNRFLSLLEITFRRDPNNFRPRINKLNSIKVQ